MFKGSFIAKSRRVTRNRQKLLQISQKDMMLSFPFPSGRMTILIENPEVLSGRVTLQQITEAVTVVAFCPVLVTKETPTVKITFLQYLSFILHVLK